MLPDLPLVRFTYLGNSALAERITYVELNVDPANMDEYTAALLLPHTNLRRFPSVRISFPGK